MMALPKQLEDGTPYLSHSQVKELLTCPARYRFKYVEGLKEPIGVDAVLGFAVHDALEHAFTQVMNGERPTVADVGDDATARFRDKVASTTNLSVPEDADFDAMAAEARALAVLGFEEVLARGFLPLDAEGEVVRRVEDFALYGRLDLLAETPGDKVVLVDVKTAKRAPNGGTASRAHALQVLNYVPGIEEARSRAVDEVWILYLVRTKAPKAVWCQVPLTSESKAWATSILKAAAKQIRNGDFPPNPIGAGFLCDPRFCGFWSVCPGAPRHEGGVGDA